VADGWQGIRITVNSDKQYLAPIRTLVREATDLAGFEEEEAEKIVLAVQEGCANVIRHCYNNCPTERMDIWFCFDDEELEIRIVDYGTFVDPSKIKSRDLDEVRPGGLGVHLMQKVMDEVTYEENESGGTTLTLRKRVPVRDDSGGDFL